MNDFTKVGELINSFFNTVDIADINRSNSIVQIWKNIAGIKLGNHSRIIDIKKGVLFIEVDHPGWIQMLQLRRNEILPSLNRLYPQLEIHSLAFVLKESNKMLSEIKTRDQEKVVVNNIVEETDFVESYNSNIEQIPELKTIFEKLKNTMKHK